MNGAGRTQRSSDPAAACLSRLERFAERRKTEHLFELQILKCQASRKRLLDRDKTIDPRWHSESFHVSGWGQGIKAEIGQDHYMS